MTKHDEIVNKLDWLSILVVTGVLFISNNILVSSGSYEGMEAVGMLIIVVSMVLLLFSFFWPSYRERDWRRAK